MDVTALFFTCISVVLDAVQSVLPGLMQASEVANDSNKYFFGIDMSIEGLRSKEYSYYIFGFLIASLILFTYIIYLYLPKNLSSLKLGEKIMFGSIGMGVVLAIIIGYIQLIEGYLL
jgi:hypothetical protein